MDIVPSCFVLLIVRYPFEAPFSLYNLHLLQKIYWNHPYHRFPEISKIDGTYNVTVLYLAFVTAISVHLGRKDSKKEKWFYRIKIYLNIRRNTLHCQRSMFMVSFKLIGYLVRLDCIKCFKIISTMVPRKNYSIYLAQ